MPTNPADLTMRAIFVGGAAVEAEIDDITKPVAMYVMALPGYTGNSTIEVETTLHDLASPGNPQAAWASIEIGGPGNYIQNITGPAQVTVSDADAEFVASNVNAARRFMTVGVPILCRGNWVRAAVTGATANLLITVGGHALETGSK